MSKTLKQVPVRIENELYEKAKLALEEEDRSFNKYVLQLIKKDLKKRGVKL